MSDRIKQSPISIPIERADDRQVGGHHYKGMPETYQHWNVVAAMNWGYFVGQITRYLWRWEAKGSVIDLQKARHYLDKLIELEQAKRTKEDPAEGAADSRYVNQDR